MIGDALTHRQYLLIKKPISRERKIVKLNNMGRGSKYMKQPSRFINTGNHLLNTIIDSVFVISIVAMLRVLALEIYLCFRTGSVSKLKNKQLYNRIFKEGVYWGTIAGAYIGLEYLTMFICSSGNWKNALLAGALTGAAVSAVASNSKDKMAADAITGGAIATAAKVLDYLT